MKKRLAIVQIIVLLLSALLPLLDGMFEWTTYTMFENLGKKEMSLQNLMTVQQIGGGPLLYWIFYISLAGMLLYCILEIFFEDKVRKTKAVIAIPIISFLLGILMIITGDAHNDVFNWYGETRYVGVSLGVLAYVELTLLITVPLIECYKQFKSEK